MKRLVIGCLAWCATSVFADVAEVRLWDPLPGRGAETMAAAVEAKAIQEKLGAEVQIGNDQHGNMHYSLIFEDWEAWGKFQAAMDDSKEWAEWFQKFAADPPAQPAGVFHVNNPVVAEPNKVSLVYSWDVMPGQGAQMMANAQEAVGLHSKMGASAGINVDQLGNVHYELTFDSWAAWGRFTKAVQASEEWGAFIQRASQEPAAELVQVYMIERYDP